jgi:hypothetical protein
MGFIAMLFGVVGTLFVVLFALVGAAIFVTLYVMCAIGISAMANRRGFSDRRILAWIPFANYYLIGLMQPELTLFGQKLTQMQVILPVAGVVAFLGFVPLVGWLVPPLVYALVGAASFPLFKNYTKDNTLLHAIFWPVGYFLLRNK